MDAPSEHRSHHNTGQAGEYLVAAELARAGYPVAMFTGNAHSIDILAYRSGNPLAIKVKAVARGSHQFNATKFIDITFEDDGRQTIHGPKQDIDPELLIVFVYVGKQREDDAFHWGKVHRFAEFLANDYRSYVERHGGRRPGKNPKSAHAALARKDIELRFPHRSLDEFLAKSSA